MGPHLSQPFRFPLWPFWETLHPPPYNVKRQRHHAVRGHCESARCRHPGHLTNPSGLAAHDKPKRQLAWYPQKERYNSLRFWQKTPWSSFDEFPKVQKTERTLFTKLPDSSCHPRFNELVERWSMNQDPQCWSSSICWETQKTWRWSLNLESKPYY